MSPHIGNVYHVSSLEQALSIYAAARATGGYLPTFTTTLTQWPTVNDDIQNSFALEHETPERKHRWSGVVIHVTVVDQAPLIAPAPLTLQ